MKLASLSTSFIVCSAFTASGVLAIPSSTSSIYAPPFFFLILKSVFMPVSLNNAHVSVVGFASFLADIGHVTKDSGVG